MAPMARPALSRNQSMQKYILLSAQKEALQRRMSLQLPFGAPMSTSSPEFRSMSSSPSSPDDYTGAYPTATEPVPTQAGTTIRTSMDDTHTDESQKLYEINHQIVATLTELMNTESVRSDERNRAWIQEKLMEAEHQIRRQRRRHSSNAERNSASMIAQHLDLDFNSPRTWA